MGITQMSPFVVGSMLLCCNERQSGIRVFTGERITSASARHILGEEACRALLLLNSTDADTVAALNNATQWMIDRVAQAAHKAPRNTDGTYCCGKCTVGLWRNIVAGGLDRQDQRLKLGLSRLRTMRHGNGEWKAFPFWYTVLTLTEMDRPDSRKELQYAAARIEAEAKRAPGPTIYARRRNAVALKATERI